MSTAKLLASVVGLGWLARDQSSAPPSASCLSGSSWVVVLGRRDRWRGDARPVVRGAPAPPRLAHLLAPALAYPGATAIFFHLLVTGCGERRLRRTVPWPSKPSRGSESMVTC